MPESLALARTLQAELSRKYAVPAAVLADAWVDTITQPAGLLPGAAVRDDLAYIWEYEADLLAAVPLPAENTPPELLLGLVAMYWTARFMALLTVPCALSTAVCQSTMAFFIKAAADYVPAGTTAVRATGLRTFINRQRVPAVGALILAVGTEYLAVYGPEITAAPRPRGSAPMMFVRRCTSQTAAVVLAMRHINGELLKYPTLAAGGVIGGAEFLPAGWSATDRCPRCQELVGSSGLCYSCEQITPPIIVDPLLLQQQRHGTRSKILAALQRQGVDADTAQRIWQAERRKGAAGNVGARDEEGASALLQQLGLAAGRRDLEPADIRACARLQFLLGGGERDRLRLERGCYQSLVLNNAAEARVLAQHHDQMADALAYVGRLEPLVEQVTSAAPISRPLVHLITARSATPAGATEVLGAYLAREDVPSSVSAVKALQWLASASPLALRPLTAALRHQASLVRQAAAQGLAWAALGPNAPPAAVLLATAQSDWNPFARQSAAQALALANVPPCPVCGEFSAASGSVARCLADDQVVRRDLAEEYGRYRIGVGYNAVAQGVVRQVILSPAVGDLARDPENIARMLQDNTTSPTAYIQALAALAQVQAEEPEAAATLLTLVRSPDLAVAVTAIQRLVTGGVYLTAHPDLLAGLLACAVTLLAQGQVAAAAALFPVYPEAPWAEQYGELRDLFHAAALLGLPASTNPTAVRLAALAEQEWLLTEARFAGHPWAALVLVRQYNTQAQALGVPPHPLAPVLPPAAAAPWSQRLVQLYKGLPAAERATALAALAEAAAPLGTLTLGLALAAPEAESWANEVLPLLAALGFAYCPLCARFFPTAWGHKCKPPARELTERDIPASWGMMTPELDEALGVLRDKPVGQLFAYVLPQDPALTGAVEYSRLHALSPDDSVVVPPAAMLAQAGDTWLAIMGPADDQVVVEEKTTRLAAWLAAQAFLRQAAKLLVRKVPPTPEAAPPETESSHPDS